MGPLSFDGGLMFWTLVTFACLFLILARFTFKPLRKFLDEREATIRRALDEAQKAKKRAEEILAQNEERLDRAREETRRIISEGHKIVTEMKREARQKAKQDAGLIVDQARSEIDRELQKSLDELKDTVASLSVRIARQVIKGHLDTKRHEELADDFIERLKKSHASKRPRNRAIC